MYAIRTGVTAKYGNRYASRTFNLEEMPVNKQPFLQSVNHIFLYDLIYYLRQYGVVLMTTDHIQLLVVYHN